MSGVPTDFTVGDDKLKSTESDELEAAKKAEEEKGQADDKLKFSLNLMIAGPRNFSDTVTKFEKWRLSESLPPLTITDGWHYVTPKMAEEFLRRNRKNRTVHFPTVVAYARELANTLWKKTGQPLIFGDDDSLRDGQHRLWACYLTQVGFWTYIVTGVEDDDGMLFAYLDNIRPRSPGDALETAGYDGLSKHLGAVINTYAHKWDEGTLVYSGHGARTIGKLSPREVIAYVQDNPDLPEVATYIEENYGSARTRLDPQVATVLCWKISQTHSIDAVDAFMQALSDSSLPEGHPVIALRKKIDPPLLRKTEIARGLKATPVPPAQRLAYAILAFNAMIRGESVKELQLVLGEPFPTLIDPIPAEAEAAQ
jgi:hypothetical protein